MTENEPQRTPEPSSPPAVPPPFAVPHAAPPQYAQPAYPPPQYGQPDYGQGPEPSTLAQAPAWGAPDFAWPQVPRKERKVWPWVVGGAGALVVLAGGATALILGVNGALNADQNENYTGAPITAGDKASSGNEILISDDGAVAFEIGADWIEAGTLADISSLTDGLPDDAALMAAYVTFDPMLAADEPPSFVVVIEGAPEQQLGAIDVKSAHTDLVAGALDSLEGTAFNVESSGPEDVTTANGLDGLVTSIACEAEGFPVRFFVYTFARGERLAFIQVYSYNETYDDATAALVTDSLRIDK